MLNNKLLEMYGPEVYAMLTHLICEIGIDFAETCYMMPMSGKPNVVLDIFTTSDAVKAMTRKVCNFLNGYAGFGEKASIVLHTGELSEDYIKLIV